jgi:hypothetical protein
MNRNDLGWGQNSSSQKREPALWQGRVQSI